MCKYGTRLRLNSHQWISLLWATSGDPDMAMDRPSSYPWGLSIGPAPVNLAPVGCFGGGPSLFEVRGS